MKATLETPPKFRRRYKSIYNYIYDSINNITKDKGIKIICNSIEENDKAYINLRAHMYNYKLLDKYEIRRPFKTPTNVLERKIIWIVLNEKCYWMVFEQQNNKHTVI